jgi:F-type H+-transporting ATPase subunit delta
VAEKDRLVQGYAEALFAVAQAEGTLEDVEEELYRFSKTLEREPALREALTDPRLPVERKVGVLQDILGSRAKPQTINLLKFLVEQGRARDLPDIAEALAQMAAGRYHKTVAEIRAAIPLDEQRRARLTEALAKASGREVELKVLVDPSVIGGVTARVGDQVFDGTIRRKLELARNQLGRVQ